MFMWSKTARLYFYVFLQNRTRTFCSCFFIIVHLFLTDLTLNRTWRSIDERNYNRYCPPMHLRDRPSACQAPTTFLFSFFLFLFIHSLLSLNFHFILWRRPSNPSRKWSKTQINKLNDRQPSLPTAGFCPFKGFGAYGLWPTSNALLFISFFVI